MPSRFLSQNLLLLISEYSDWKTRRLLPLIGTDWKLICCDCDWEKAFYKTHGCLAQQLLQIDGKMKWFGRIIVADCLSSEDSYSILFEVSDLLNSKWQRHIFHSDSAIDHLVSLSSRLNLIKQNTSFLPTSCIDIISKSIKDVEFMSKLIPYVDLWASSNHDLATLEKSYLTNVGIVGLISLRECQSALLVTLQEVINKVIGRVMQDTKTDVSCVSNLQQSSLKELIEVGIHHHSEIYSNAWNEIKNMMHLSNRLATAMSTDITFPASQVISKSGSIDATKSDEFVKILEGVREKLLPLKGNILNYIIEPWETDLKLVIGSIRNLRTVVECLSQAQRYYQKDFVCQQYPKDAEFFSCIWESYVSWITLSSDTETFYDCCLKKYSGPELGKFKDQVDELDLLHVVTASISCPQSFFFEIEDVRRNLLMPPTVEEIPLPVIHRALPFFERRPLQFKTISTSDPTVSQIICQTKDVSFSDPLLIANGPVPLEEVSKDFLWSIGGVIQNRVHSISDKYAEGTSFYNTAPLWVSQISHSLRRDCHKSLTSLFEKVNETSSDSSDWFIDRLAEIKHQCPRQIAAAIWCTYLINDSFSTPPTQNLNHISDQFTFLASHYRHRCLSLSDQSSDVSPVFDYYRRHVLNMLQFDSVEDQFSEYENILRYHVESNPLGGSLNCLRLEVGSTAGIRFACSVLGSSFGSFHSCGLITVENILKRLCANPLTNAKILCLELEKGNPVSGQDAIPIEIITSVLCSSLGMNCQIVDCKHQTSESLVRSFVACSASGRMLVLKGINLIPTSLSPLLQSCVVSLSESERKGWTTITKWASWPIQNMPASENVGYSTRPVVVATLEEDQTNGLYKKGSFPLDYDDAEALEAIVPWEIVEYLSLLWIPVERVESFISCQLNLNGISCSVTDVESVWCPLLKTLNSLPRGGFSFQQAYLSILHHLNSSTKYTFESLISMMKDISVKNPNCLRQSSETVNGIQDTRDAVFVIMDLLLSAILEPRVGEKLRNEISTTGPQLPDAFKTLRESVERKMLLQGYNFTSQFANGSMALLLLSYFIPVTLMITYSPQQQLIQGLSVLLNQVPHAKTSHLIVLHEGALFGDHGSLVAAVRESKAKSVSDNTVGWIIIHLTEKTLRNKTLIKNIAAIARERALDVPTEEWRHTEATTIPKPPGISLGNNTKIILVVNRQCSSLELLLPFVLLVKLSIEEA